MTKAVWHAWMKGKVLPEESSKIEEKEAKEK